MPAKKPTKPEWFTIAGPIRSEAMQGLDSFLEDLKGPGIISICSGGGDTYGAMLAVDWIGRAIGKGRHITTIGIGHCESAAAMIWLAGNKRLVQRHTRLMFHGPTIGGDDLTIPQVKDMVKTLEICEAWMMDVFMAYTGWDQARIKKALLGRDVFFTAEEAFTLGLSHGIYDPGFLTKPTRAANTQKAR